MSNGKLVNKPTFIDSKNCRFLICDRPTDENLPDYLEIMKKKKVVQLVRACEPSYETDPLKTAGIKVMELPFADGDPPPEEVVSGWLEVVSQTFAGKGNSNCIAVHCVAGLGRAPVLVAIALVENGMDPYEAIAFIRKRRRGAINARQLKYIENYKRRGAGEGCSCVVM